MPLIMKIYSLGIQQIRVVKIIKCTFYKNQVHIISGNTFYFKRPNLCNKCSPISFHSQYFLSATNFMENQLESQIKCPEIMQISPTMSPEKHYSYERHSLEAQLKQDLQRAFDHKRDALNGFFYYCGLIAGLPSYLLKEDSNCFFIPFYAWNLISLPITIPAAIATSPLFFTVRSVVTTVKTINDAFDQRRFNKIENQVNQNYANQVSEQTLQKAIKQTTTKTFIENKKRLIVVSQSKKIGNNINPKEDLPQQDQKEFIFVADENLSLMEIVKVVKQKMGNQRESLHFFSESKVLRTDTKISALRHDQFGMIRINFAKVETYG